MVQVALDAVVAEANPVVPRVVLHAAITADLSTVGQGQEALAECGHLAHYATMSAAMALAICLRLRIGALRRYVDL